MNYEALGRYIEALSTAKSVSNERDKLLQRLSMWANSCMQNYTERGYEFVLAGDFQVVEELITAIKLKSTILNGAIFAANESNVSAESPALIFHRLA